VSALPAHRYAFSASPCGGTLVELAGVEVLLRPSGALWIASERMLAVADLHLEKGSAYATRGQLLPPYDTRETLARLAAEVGRLRPRTVALLGDSFHDGGGEARLAPADAQALRAIAAVATLTWIVGNHDREGPKGLPGEIVSDIDACGLSLTHEPHPAPRHGEIAGHLHPAAKIKGRVGSVRRRCFITDGERLVAPAFGAYAGGLSVRDPAFRGLFVRAPLAVALGERQTHAIAWSQLAGE